VLAKNNHSKKLQVIGAIIAILCVSMLLLTSCETGNPTASQQRTESINFRSDMWNRAEAKYPLPYTKNFPLRGVLYEYTLRQDMVNHPWYTYILSDYGTITAYFVSTTLPVSTSAFLSSTEDLTSWNGEPVVLTAPSLDGMYYGGSGSTTSNSGWIFIDATTGAMGVIYACKIITFDAPLILETEPLLIQVQAK
jgi:hypothetical protein